LYAIDGLYYGQAGSDPATGPHRQQLSVIRREPFIIQGSLF
jgi:hypothetical protein